MTDKPMSESAFAGKVEWEGGVTSALDYGLKPADAPEGPIRDAWTRAYQLWQQLDPIISEINLLLDGVEHGDEDEDGEG
jgi:hypothetical protein